jgi:hypothetical protein
MLTKRARKLWTAIIIVACCCWSLVVLVRGWSLVGQGWSLDVVQERNRTDNNQESKAKATVEAYTYAQSFIDIDRRLLFVHIPKTAGSTMEIDVALGQDRNLTWGECMFLSGASGCPVVRDAKNRFGRAKNSLPSYWHVPVHYFALHSYNPYDADTFAVIRHPVDRVVSEYQYVCRRVDHPRKKASEKRLCKNMTSFIESGLNPKETKNFAFQEKIITGSLSATLSLDLSKHAQWTISCKWKTCHRTSSSWSRHLDCLTCIGPSPGKMLHQAGIVQRLPNCP